MEIKIIKQEESKEYQKLIAELYIDSFSTGKSFQYHNKEETEKYIQKIFKLGYGIVALENQQITGTILLAPLSFDELIPNDISQSFDINRSVYVAELMVAKTKQNQGIGKKLLLYFLETVDRKTYQNAFIRVWVENTAAVALYKKVGFTACASIIQPKLLADKSGMFDFKKIYLHQELS